MLVLTICGSPNKSGLTTGSVHFTSRSSSESELLTVNMKSSSRKQLSGATRSTAVKSFHVVAILVHINSRKGNVTYFCAKHLMLLTFFFCLQQLGSKQPHLGIISDKNAQAPALIPHSLLLKWAQRMLSKHLYQFTIWPCIKSRYKVFHAVSN